VTRWIFDAQGNSIVFVALGPTALTLIGLGLAAVSLWRRRRTGSATI